METAIVLAPSNKEIRVVETLNNFLKGSLSSGYFAGTLSLRFGLSEEEVEVFMSQDWDLATCIRVASLAGLPDYIYEPVLRELRSLIVMNYHPGCGM